jgi:hypothetical protein
LFLALAGTLLRDYVCVFVGGFFFAFAETLLFVFAGRGFGFPGFERAFACLRTA